MGTNSRVLETQTAALRYALGDRHTYDYAEGVLPAEMHSDIQEFFPQNDAYFSYCDVNDPMSCRKAVADLDAFIAAEGPFDGVIAFSQGAAVATTLMVQRQRRNPSKETISPAFKCAIFLGAGIPCDPDELEEGRIRELSFEVDGEVLQVPTTHIWGRHDPSPYPPCLAKLCAQEKRNVYIHRGGHEIPGSQDNAILRECVRVMNRSISMAKHSQFAS